jgi:signal transduction histidine kinase
MIDVARREAGADSYAGPGRPERARAVGLRAFRRLEKSPGLRLEVASRDLPPVALDGDAVDDAVTNLLSNAWKYRRGDAAHVR